MTDTQRDQLLIETHTTVLELKRQVEVVFNKFNGVDNRFRNIDDRCTTHLVQTASIRTRVAILWAFLIMVLGTVIATVVKVFLT